MTNDHPEYLHHHRCPPPWPVIAPSCHQAGVTAQGPRLCILKSAPRDNYPLWNAPQVCPEHITQQHHWVSLCHYYVSVVWRTLCWIFWTNFVICHLMKCGDNWRWLTLSHILLLDVKMSPRYFDEGGSLISGSRTLLVTYNRVTLSPIGHRNLLSAPN